MSLAAPSPDTSASAPDMYCGHVPVALVILSCHRRDPRDEASSLQPACPRLHPPLPLLGRAPVMQLIGSQAFSVLTLSCPLKRAPSFDKPKGET